MTPNAATLIIDSTENSADLLYRCQFHAPDPVIFIEYAGKRIIVLSDLEIDRGRAEADVDVVLSLSEYRKKSAGGAPASYSGVVDAVFAEFQIKEALVPGGFPIKYADELRAMGYKISYKPTEPYFEGRLRKTPEQVNHIRRALRKTAEAMNLATGMVAASEIRGKKLYLEGAILTSERVKGEINAYLSKQGYTASHTIVACGAHSAMPHHRGEGAIFAGKSVVIDIFPRSQESGYFGDMTRTVVKGEPPARLEAMYEAALEGQKLGISLIRHGARAREVHEAIVESFSRAGFKTGLQSGRMQGFIHSTGHGLGLEIHEPPRIGMGDETLEEGNVVTVEPGLYYAKLGGIRIEDVVLVTRDGCVNLTKCPKRFRV
ncbi:MAG: M24 family metallopeptidase [Deltaproteobacteria bacterium]